MTKSAVRALRSSLWPIFTTTAFANEPPVWRVPTESFICATSSGVVAPCPLPKTPTLAPWSGFRLFRKSLTELVSAPA